MVITMIRNTLTASGIVHVELDAAQGRLILVQCPAHGRMAESMEQQAYVCTEPGCGLRLSRAEAEQVRIDGFDEIAAADKRDKREDAHKMEDRRQARFREQREEK
jgi:hypothetical protein